MSNNYPTALTRATAENMLDDAEPGMYILAVYPGRHWTHSVHLDKKNLPRTYCGVPITASSKWHQNGFGTADLITCGTCQGAVAKHARPDRSGGHPEATERASRPAAVCFAVLEGRRVPSATGRHVPNMLKTNYHGEPQEPWCTWCGAKLDSNQAQAQVDDSTVLVVRDGDVVVTTVDDANGTVNAS